MSLIRGHFSGLFRFSGRERRQPFWLWVLIVMGVTILVWVGFMAVFMTSMFQRIEQFAQEHPDQVTRTVGPGSYSVQVHGYHPELMPDIVPMILVLTLIAITGIVLLAAAVARRLHDSGRSGWWGVMPLPFLAFGFGAMAWMFTTMTAMQGATEPPASFFAVFALLFLNNLVYLGTLVTLIIFCCMPSQWGDNRYGPGVTEQVWS